MKVSDHGSVHFVSGSCAPLSSYDPFFYTFKGSIAEHLILINQGPASGSLGNYPVPIRVGARFVKCDATRYLARLSDAASFTLACVTPMS